MSERRHSGTRRMARIVAVAALAVLALLLVLAVAAPLALRSAAVRQRLLAHAARIAERDLGVGLRARDFELRPYAGFLAIDELELAAPGEAPFLAIGRVTLSVAPTSLGRRPIVVRALGARRVRVDLARPLPRGPEAGAPAEAESGGRVEVRRLEIDDLAIAGPPPPAAELGIEDWRLEGLRLAGALTSGRVELAASGGRLLVGRSGRVPLEADLELALSGPEEGPLRLTKLDLRGPEIAATAEGTLGLAAEQALALSFTLDAEPSLLGPVPAGAERVRAEGAIDLRAGAGSLRLAAPSLPAELAEPWIGAETLQRFSAAGTRLSVDADLGLAAGRVEGRAELEWRAPDAVLLRLAVDGLPAVEEDAGPMLAVTADLLPAAAGSRRVSFELPGDEALAPDRARLYGGRLQLELPDARAGLGALARRWPALLPPDATAGIPGGPLALSGRFEGPLLDPEARLEGSWRPAPGAALEVAARGRPAATRGEATVAWRVADLSALGLGLSGATSGRARATKGEGEPEVALVVDASDLDFVDGEPGGPEAAGGGPLVASLHAEATAVGRQVRLAELDVSAAGRELTGSGTLTLETPLRRGRFDLRIERPLDPVEAAEASLELAAGVLRLRAPTVVLPRGRGRLEADLPLATLAGLPGLEALGTLPLERAAGDIALRWELPPADWLAGQAEEGGLRGPLRAAARGDLRFDPARPARAAGEIELPLLELEVGGVEVGAEGPVRLALAEGRARLGPASIRSGERVLRLEAAGELDPDWTPGRPPRELLRHVELEAVGSIAGELFAPLAGVVGTIGEVAVDLRAAGAPAALAGRLELRSPQTRIAIGEAPGLMVAAPELRLALDAGRLKIEAIRLALDGGELSLAGELEAARPLADATLRLEWIAGEGALRRAVVDAEVRDGLLHVPAARLETAEGALDLEGRLPLAALEALPALSGRLPGSLAAGPLAPGPVTLRWNAAEADWSSLLPAPAEGEPIPLRAAARGSLLIDPRRPTEAEAEIELTAISAEVAGHRLESPDGLRARVGQRRFTLEPFVLITDGAPFELEAAAVLAADPAGGPESWLESLSLRANGTVVASLLDPYLEGGEAEGLLHLEAEAEGGLPDLRGTVRVRGPGATLFFPLPYPTKLGNPDLEIVVDRGRVNLERAVLSLNDGTVRLEGGFATGPGGEGSVDLRAALSGIRYRLDYGLIAVLEGALRLAGEVGERLTLSGEVTVDKGVLTRDISLTRDFVTALLAPVDLTGTEESALEAIELDVTVATRRGVRIKNNLADLLVRWDPLTVRGNLVAPLPRGRVEVDPGGLVFALGQTVRLDSAALVYPGEPGAEARLELVTTSSLEDPSIKPLAGADPFAEASDVAAAAPAEGGMAEEITTFVGEKLASRLSESLAGTTVSLRPVMVFGEVDPGARLTVSRSFSPVATLAASIDLRNAERQTFLLDLHDFPQAPRLTGQVFTDDVGDQGATLQQTLELGKGSREEEPGPRIRAVRLDRPPGVSKRGMKRALVYGKGDRLAEGGRFEVEVEVLDYLLRRGYPDARVAVSVIESARRPGVELEVAIDAGPRVAFRFTGDALPRPLRGSISSLYRTDFYEPRSLAEMRDQAVRAYRSLGYLQPEVEIRVEPGDPARPESARTVVVEGRGGRRVSPGAPLFPDLDPADAAELAHRFSSTVQRVELAAGLPAAERRVLDGLRALGFRQPAIRSVELSEDGDVLTVELEPGARRRIAAVEIRGVPEPERDRLLEVSGLRTGDPLKSRAVAAAAVALEEDLLDRGFSDADVIVRVADARGADGDEATVLFEVDPGELARVAEVELRGLGATRPGFARKLADVEIGSPLRRPELLEARRRLFGTGLFSSVMVRSAKRPAGDAAVIFDLDEKSRFRLAYGARWESEQGGSVVVDLVDRNFLGRNKTVGLRVLAARDDRRVRLFGSIPRPLGGRGSIELFATYRDERSEVFDPFFEVTQKFRETSFETTLQFSYPLSRHFTGRVYGRYKESHLVEVDPDPFFSFFPIDERIRRPFLGLQLIYDDREDAVLPRRGLFASADLSISEKFLGAELRYGRLFGQVHLFRPAGRLGGRPLTWAQSYRLGLAEAFGQELIEEILLYAGGEFSVRGYARESLGPPELLDPIFPSIDRHSLLVINQELRYELFEPVTVLIFFDAGNTWTSGSGFSSSLFESAGLGLRAVTPLGLLRLDVAAPFDRRPGIDSSVKVYVGFGNVF